MIVHGGDVQRLLETPLSKVKEIQESLPRVMSVVMLTLPMVCEMVRGL